MLKLLGKLVGQLVRLAHQRLIPLFGVVAFVLLITTLFAPPLIRLTLLPSSSSNKSQEMISPIRPATPKTIPKPTITIVEPPSVSPPVISPKPVSVATKPAAVPPTTATVSPSPDSSVPTLTPSSSSSSSTSTSSGSNTSTNSTGTSSGSSSGSSTGSSSTTNSSNYTSTNWAGYFADQSGLSYSGISATWVTPSPTGNGSTTSTDATWIGIGGITSSDLIQVGTDDTVSANGKATEGAFYEMLPDAAVNIPNLMVKPGDTIQASLKQVSSGKWDITLEDTTNNQTFNLDVSYVSNLSSAEWIEEDPSSNTGQLYPLDDFGTIPFSNGSVVINGVTDTIATAGSFSVAMVSSSGQVIATPSNLGNDGASFTVSWQGTTQ